MFSPWSRPSLASDAPIGIFDSGIGGLTVAHAMAQAMPGESLLYFGDTAHMPYGDRSPELVRTYSVRIAQYLREEGCKAIVIACNSASAAATDAVREVAGEDIPVMDVVQPVVEYLAERGVARVGVIGTRATVGSGIYGRSLAEARARREGDAASLHPTVEWPTPLLAPLIEEGWHDHALMEPVIASYLTAAGWLGSGMGAIDALVLGCTHYPLADEVFRRVVGPHVELVDGPGIVAKAVSKALDSRGLRRSDSLPRHQFLVSDLTENFKRSAERFFGEEIPLQPGGPWFKG